MAGETAAALAAASIVFAQVNPTYSATCLSHAQDLYNFAKQNQGSYSSSIAQASSFYRYKIKRVLFYDDYSLFVVLFVIY